MKWLKLLKVAYQCHKRLREAKDFVCRIIVELRGPNWGLFCPEIRAFTVFGGEISSTVSKVLSYGKVLQSVRNCLSTETLFFRIN